MRVKKYLPKRVFFFLKSQKIGFKLLKGYFYDFKRYFKYSGAIDHTNAEHKLRAAIIMNYHVVEKGLTMPETRLGFGRDAIAYLIANCQKYIESYDKNNPQLQHALDVVSEYKNLHSSNKFNLDQELLDSINYLEQFKNSVEDHRQISQSNIEYFKHRESAFDLFSNSRYSLRNYSKEEVPIDTIKEALKLAQNAPSACNRQTAGSYVFTDPEKIKELLTLQGGNRGFGHLANKLIIITAEVGKFFGTNERNQVFIDGGIYAMNLLYSLHFFGIGACILNCSHDPAKDRRIRKASNIKESEVFIAMISCGYPPNTFKLASSKRCDIEKTASIF